MRQNECPHGVVTGCHNNLQHSVHSKSLLSTELPSTVLKAGLISTSGKLNDNFVEISIEFRRGISITFTAIQFSVDLVDELVKFRIGINLYFLEIAFRF